VAIVASIRVSLKPEERILAYQAQKCSERADIPPPETGPGKIQGNNCAEDRTQQSGTPIVRLLHSQKIISQESVNRFGDSSNEV
jgi:hypothetical protein